MKFYLAQLLTLVCLSAAAQTTVFHENFDAPSGPDSVSTYHTNTSTNGLWNDTSAFAVSQSNSFHTQITPLDSVVFETQAFSTEGNRFVQLTFQHIAKIHLAQRGYLQVSTNNGTSWTNLTGADYLGESPQFQSIGYFNELSYPVSNVTPYWHGPTVNASSIVAPTNNWWAKETFDISNIAGAISAQGDTGFAQVKVRFLAVHQILVPISASGWYVDDVQVVAKKSPFSKPIISFDKSNAVKPTGTQYLLNQIIQLRVTDTIGPFTNGINRVELIHRRNGGSWQVDTMGINNATCPTATDADASIYNVLAGDTIDWYVRAITCGNTDTVLSPSISATNSYYTFWRIQDYSDKCWGGTNNTTSPFVVNSLPYDENFDDLNFWIPGTGTGAFGTSHRGHFPNGNGPVGLNWVNSPANYTPGYAWSIRTGPTATGLTGPSSDHSTSNGNYLYVEADQGWYGNVAILLSPCIDLTSDSCAVLEFYLHMYGADAHIFHVDIDTSDVLPQLWHNFVWQNIGQIQSSSTDDWQHVVIPLSDYAGKIIKIRFVAHRGGGELGDIAIDDFRLFKPTDNDVFSNEIVSPVNGNCGYTDKEALSVRFSNIGCDNLPKIPLAYQVTIPNSSTPITVWDTLYNPTLQRFDTIFTFKDSLDLSNVGNYAIRAFSHVSGDLDRSNDTTQVLFVEHLPVLNNFPYLCTFDESPWEVGNKTRYNPGVYDYTLFNPYPQSSSTTNSWIVGNKFTPSGYSGPSGDYGSTRGNYLFFDREYASGNTTAVYESRCMDFSGLQNPHMSFMYHKHVYNVELKVEIQLNDSTSWVTLPGSQLPWTQPFDVFSDWKYKEIDLTAYAGEVVRIRFTATDLSNSVGTSNIAIDNLMLFDKAPYDVSVSQIISPERFLNLPASVLPKVVIRNNGSQSLSNIPLALEITPQCLGTPTIISAIYASSLSPGAIDTVTFTNVPNYTSGEFQLKAYVNLPNDAFAGNDTIVRYLIGREVINVSKGYSQNFDSCSTFSEGYLPGQSYRLFAVDGANQSPFNGAYSAPNSLVIYRSSDAVSNIEVVNLPVMIGFDSILDAKLTFWHNYEFGGLGFGGVEFYNILTSTWELLGYERPSAFIPSCDSLYEPDSNGDIGFRNNSIGWKQECIRLSRFNNSTKLVYLRFRVQGDGLNNEMYWAIDDIEIELTRELLDLSTSDVLFDRMPNVGLDSIEFEVNVANVGVYDVNSFEFNFAIDGVPFGSKTVHLNPSLEPYMSQIQKLALSTLGLTVGSHELCVWTTNPNGLADNNTANDTLCVVFEFLGETTNYPYCADFEISQSFNADDISSSTGSAPNWKYGEPAKSTLNGAHGGAKCWVTQTTGNYLPNAESYLYTGSFVVDSASCYNVNFYQNYKTQNLLDGGNVQYSLDSGNTWQVLGKYGDNTWYNQPNILSLGTGKPGFSGNSGGWQKAAWQGKFATTGTVMFRFLFASNVNVEDEGWAIDDFCVEEVLGTCFIGIEENNMGQDITISPNPAANEITISRAFTSDSYTVTVLNMEGREIDTFTFENGQSKMSYSVAQIPNGVYSLVFKTSKNVHVKRFVVSH